MTNSDHYPYDYHCNYLCFSSSSSCRQDREVAVRTNSGLGFRERFF